MCESNITISTIFNLYSVTTTLAYFDIVWLNICIVSVFLSHCSLEVTLEKVEEGQWACLLKEEGQLPLRLPQEHLSKEELDHVKRMIQEVSSSSTANSAQEVDHL